MAQQAPEWQALETFIESTANMPAELARSLNTIRVLDEKCADLTESLRGTAERMVALPVQHGAPSADFQELSRRWERDQKLLVQVCMRRSHAGLEASEQQVSALTRSSSTDFASG